MVEGKIAQGRGVLQFLQGQGFLPEPPQLLVAEVQFPTGLQLAKGIGVAAGGDVGQGHPRLHPALQFQIVVHLVGRPVIHHLHPGVATFDAVNAPEPLHNAHRIPVDVVVDDGVAVLQVLPLGNAVRGNQQVNIGVAGGVPALTGYRRKVGQDGVEIVAAGRGLTAVPGNHGNVEAQLPGQVDQVGVQILRRILESGEYQQLAIEVALPVNSGLRRLGAEGSADSRQLAVPLRSNGLYLRQGGGKRLPVLPQVGLPAAQIQLRQAIGIAPPVDEKLLVLPILLRPDVGVGQIRGGLAVLPVAVNLVQQLLHLADGALQGQGQGMGGTFQPFQKVRPHHSNQKPLAVLLIEVVALAGGGQFLQPLRVGYIAGGLVQGQPEFFDVVGQALVGQAALRVGGRMFIDRRGLFGKAPNARHFGGVELLDQAAGAGYGYAVQQPPEVSPQRVQQPGFIPAAAPALLRFPFPELFLRRRHHSADVADAQALPESVLPLFGHQVNLIPQIYQGSVHRRSRQQQHFGAGPAADNFLQQPLVALPLVIAEVVGFVNNHQIIVAPIEVGEVDAADIAGIPRQIGMGQQGVAETILVKGVLAVVIGGLIQRPVGLQLFGAKHQGALVPQLKVFDDGQSGVGFAQAHAVGQDAAVMGLQLGDDAADAVFLKLVEDVPDLAVGKAAGGQGLISGQPCRDVFAEQFVQGFVIHPFRGVVAADALQGIQDPPFDILGALPVIPEAAKPFLQFGQGGGIRGRQVDFQIGLAAAAQPALGKVGTADDGGAARRPGSKVKFAMQKVGLPDGADGYPVALDPFGAPPR